MYSCKLVPSAILVVNGTVLPPVGWAVVPSASVDQAVSTLRSLKGAGLGHVSYTTVADAAFVRALFLAL